MNTVPQNIQDAATEAQKIKDRIAKGESLSDDDTATTDAADPKATLEAEITSLEKKKADLIQDINTENGKYGNRLQLMQQRIDQLTGNVDKLTKEKTELIRQMNEAARKAPEPGSASAADDPDKIREIVGDQFLSEYGNDLPTKVVELIKATIKPLADDVTAMKSGQTAREEADRAEQEQAQAAAHERENAFWSAVEQQVPGARVMNDSDSNWLMFLNAVDPQTGMTRLQAGQQAITRGDINAVVELYKAYFDQQEAPAGVKPTAKKEDQIDPPGSKAGSGEPAQSSKPELTNADWEAFHRDVVEHPNKYSIAEVKAKNDEFRQALLEGRLK